MCLFKTLLTPDFLLTQSLTTFQSQPPTTLTYLTSSNIAIINAAAFAWASKMDSSQVFILNCQDTKLHTSKAKHSVDLSCIPEEYHEFSDIFNTTKANTLAPHQLYKPKD